MQPAMVEMIQCNYMTLNTLLQ